MAKTEVIDSQIEIDDLGYTSSDVNLLEILKAVKKYIALDQNASKVQRKSPACNSLQSDKTVRSITQLKTCNQTFPNKELKAWVLPEEISVKYAEKGIKELFDWQVSCLGNAKVLNCNNLVCSAPTSAGKSLVAEILAIKTILERNKKVIVALPSASMVKAKMFYLQDILSSSGIRVGGFMGSQVVPGGLQSIDMAICTIENANSLINRLLDEGTISQLGAVVVDELHALGDPHSGYILELLLAKVKYISKTHKDVKIQIIGMSATVCNLEILVHWLDAVLFKSWFRPIPVHEYYYFGNQIFNINGNQKCDIANSASPSLNKLHTNKVLQICFDAIKDGSSVMIFCMTKNECESVSQNLAYSFFNLSAIDDDIAHIVNQQLKTESISEILEQLKNCPVGLGNIMKEVISYGVAYYHTGLTIEERDIIENAFESGVIKVLIATTALISSVNLKARMVIVTSPIFNNKPINSLIFKQMTGRAGRFGKDTRGESIIMCTNRSEKKISLDLMRGTPEAVISQMKNGNKFGRAILEIIASETACTHEDLTKFSECMLFSMYYSNGSEGSGLVSNSLQVLQNFELIKREDTNGAVSFVATSLGKACVVSSMAPCNGMTLFCELNKAKLCPVLETDLVFIYLVTPESVSSQWADIDWSAMLKIWNSLPHAMQTVWGHIMRFSKYPDMEDVLNERYIQIRFYTALALLDLINEVPLSEVAIKFQCARGFLQSLQLAATTFAGMVTAFCKQLGWKNFELQISRIRDRLHFGINSELLELINLPSLNARNARAIFNAGFETVACVSLADVNEIEHVFLKASPFPSEAQLKENSQYDLTTELAQRVILEANKYFLNHLENKQKNDTCDNNNEVSSCLLDMEDQEVENHFLPEKNSIEDDSEEEKFEYNIYDSKFEIEENGVQQQQMMPENIVHLPNCTEMGATKTNKTYHQPLQILADTQIEIERLAQNSISNATNADISLLSTRQESLSIFDDRLPIELKVVLLSDTESDELEHEDDEEDFHLVYNDDDADEDIDIKNMALMEQESSEQIEFNDKICYFSYINDDREPKTQENCMKDKQSQENLHPKINQPLSYKEVNSQTISVNDKHILEKCHPKSSQPPQSNTEMPPILSDSCDKKEDSRKRTLNDEHVLGIEPLVKCSRILKTPTLNFKKNEINHRGTVHNIFLNNFMNFMRGSNVNIEPPNKNVENKLTVRSAISRKNKNSDVSLHVFKGDDVLMKLDDLFEIHCAAMHIVLKKTAVVQQENIFGKNMVHDTALLSTESNNSEINYLAICCSKEFVYVFDLSSFKRNSSVYSKLSEWFSKPNLHLLVMSSYETASAIRTHWGVDTLASYYDINLGEWMLTRNMLSLGAMPTDNVEMTCVIASIIWSTAERQRTNLLGYSMMQRLLADDNQVSLILTRSTWYGLNIDLNLVSVLLVEAEKWLKVMKVKAHTIAKSEFNLNSPHAVAEVLRGYKMACTRKHLQKTTTTHKLHNGLLSHIFAFWRNLKTIMEILIPLAKKTHFGDDNKLHVSYNMLTRTERIRMQGLKLQRMPRAFHIPQSFDILNKPKIDAFPPKLYHEKNGKDSVEFNCGNVVVATTGCVLVSAEYCDLEIRILNFFSKDKLLNSAMKSDDVFTTIAVRWNYLYKCGVKDDLRQRMKQLCYGVIYDTPMQELSKMIHETADKTQTIVDTFYRKYSGVRSFKDSLLQDCRESGFVETLLMRRRNLPEINSDNCVLKYRAERQAIISKIKGSASDIVRGAMCEVHKRIRNLDYEPHLILQINDELVYEVPEPFKGHFITILRHAMEVNTLQGTPSRIDLPIKLKTGLTYGSLTPL